jgi:UDPglucose--hexose-1-phosphate uridylyltransferase
MATRPEWRFDPLTGRPVLISPDRAERPIRSSVACPFCAGHESETPAEVLAYREPGSPANSPGWRVRVVPNRYAAVRLDADEPETPNPSLALRVPRQSNGARSASEAGNGSPGVGIAEVFIECPHHETAFRNLSLEQVTDVLRAWRERLRFWHDDGRIAFAQVFKNEGPAAGASVEHCHSQLIGITFVPPQVADELRRSAETCSTCDWLAHERHGPRFVFESERFAVVCPIAPRFPGETWIIPKVHAREFETTDEGVLGELANTMRDLLTRIDRAFAGPDFNLIVRSAPFRGDGSFHWRIEVLPRTTTTAGWEWGTGLLINTMFPERAAELLKAACGVAA